MTLQEIQYKAQAIIQKWRDEDSAPYVEFVEELASMDVPELPEGLEEAAEKWANTTHFAWPNQVPAGKKGFIAGAEWGASYAVAPHYFKLRELKTGRVFLAEWSDIAGEWYERGNGRAYQSHEVEIVQRDKKTPTP